MPKRIYEINELGHLVFGGCDTVELAKIYGTPLYVMDAAQIDAQMKECVRAMKDQFAAYKVFYASKAFCSKAVYKMAKKNG
ncbi:MAG: diaminopimelate decarboxylase, partial [Christensenellales bacterium]